jgi:hypothetical protein
MKPVHNVRSPIGLLWHFRATRSWGAFKMLACLVSVKGVTS